MLAIVLPTAGDQAGNPISLFSDTADAENTLQISYDDTTNPGFVTATITAAGDVTASQTKVYWNFGSISFTGNADTDGAITNNVVLSTPYQANVVGFGSAGSQLPLSQTNWQVDADFATIPDTVPSPAFLDLINADSLDVKAGTLGASKASTIAGEFQSPTDLSVAGRTGAIVSLADSTVGITDSLNGAVRTYGLTLNSTNGGIAFDADVATTANLTVKGNAGSLLLGGSSPREFSSSTGDINVTSVSGPITVTGVGFQSLMGGTSITTPSSLTISGATSGFTAAATYSPTATEVPDGLVRLQGTLSLTLPSALPVTAGRLQLSTSGAAPLALTALSVASLTSTTRGSLAVANAIPLAISDFNSLTPTVEIVATDVSIQSPAGIRVVDGINASGKVVLSTFVSGTTSVPSVPVDFVVTGAGDNPRASDPFAGTLRDMVEYVNANRILSAASAAGITTQPMRLLFDESGSKIAAADAGVITLSASLPAILKPVTLEGSLPGPSADYPTDLDGIVGIDGNNKVSTGFVLGAGSSGSTLRDVAFYKFRDAGLRVESADNLIAGLNLGADRTNQAPGNGNTIGVDIAGPSAVRNVVGIRTIGVDSGNYIVGNKIGVRISGRANFTGVYGNTIGDVDVGNDEGIQVISSVGTIIGGTQADLRNTISNNTANGIRLTSVSAVSVPYGTQVVNNDISNNNAAGVLVEGGGGNLLGGTAAGAGNTLTGNGVGVLMQSLGTGRTQGNQIVNNTIADSSLGGVLIDQGYANLVQGNVISDTTQSSDWGVWIFRAPKAFGIGPNQVFQNSVSGSGDGRLNGGIVVENSVGQVIGGPGTHANTVFGNNGSGIVIVGGTGVNAAMSNLVEGNMVGMDTMGAKNGNAFDGIRIQGSVGNTVRGNTVQYQDSSANNSAGISVNDAIARNAAMGNTIVLNTVSDNHVGIGVSGGAFTAVGGRVSGLGNWVFGNTSDGIRVESSGASGSAISTVIRGNRIGIGTGTAVAGNAGNGINLVSTVGTTVDQGNLVAYSGLDGVRIEGGRNAVIGSALAGLGNVVRDNEGDGISVVAPVAGRTEAVRIAGNTVRGNLGNGISVADTFSTSASTARVSGITIGRVASVRSPDASSNTIVGNDKAGVRVDLAQAVSIIGNSITGNLGEKQIELVNDANAILSPTTASVFAPFLTVASPRVARQASPQYDVRGTVARTGTGTGAQTVLVDIYGTNIATNEQFFLGRVTVTIRANGASGSFRVIVGQAGKRFGQIVATSTLGAGTSEFSEPVGV